METFCLTALEAATTKTLAITNDLAALQNTVSNRGVIINGDPMNPQWQSHALQKLFYYMDPSHQTEKQQLIDSNYNWATNLTWKNQAQLLLSTYILPTIIINPSPIIQYTHQNKIDNIIHKLQHIIHNLLPLTELFHTELKDNLINQLNLSLNELNQLS